MPRPKLWWGLAAMTAVLTLFGIGDIAAGLDADPAIVTGIIGLTPAELRDQSAAGYRLADYLARSGGLVLATLGIALSILVLIPYRRRVGWSWGALWLLPAWALAVPLGYLLVGIVPNQPPPPPMVSGPIFAIAAAAILLADRRAFAPRSIVASRPAAGASSLQASVVELNAGPTPSR